MKKIALNPTFFAKLAFLRYLKNKKDTFIIIYGKPRTGKTTLGLHIFIKYLQLAKKLHKKGLIEFEPPKFWKDIFKTYFAVSAEDMNKKIKTLPDASAIFIDEALDFLSWHDTLTKEQQDLIELIMKTGKKGILTILITPMLSLLKKELLARAHYFFLIPSSFKNGKNIAYVLENYDNPVLCEKNPFGIYSVIKKVEKKPSLFSEIENFISLAQSQKTYKGSFRFKFINPKIYDLYEKIIKDPLILQEKGKKRYVLKSIYDKLKYMFDTILLNLYERDGKTIAQIENLLTDKFGKRLLSAQTIRKYISTISATEIPPKLEEFEEPLKEEFEKEEIKKVENESDLSFEETEDLADTDNESDDEED